VSYTSIIFDEIRATDLQMMLIPGAQALQTIFYVKRVRRPNTLYIDWYTVANLMWSTVRIITQQRVAILVKHTTKICMQTICVSWNTIEWWLLETNTMNCDKACNA
jgi:hypothetical protein